MKHFVACLFMLLLLVMGKYNRYRQPPTASLARQATDHPRRATRLPPARPAAGVASQVAALVAR